MTNWIKKMVVAYFYILSRTCLGWT